MLTAINFVYHKHHAFLQRQQHVRTKTTKFVHRLISLQQMQRIFWQIWHSANFSWSQANWQKPLEITCTYLIKIAVNFIFETSYVEEKSNLNENLQKSKPCSEGEENVAKKLPHPFSGDWQQFCHFQMKTYPIISK